MDFQYTLAVPLPDDIYGLYEFDGGNAFLKLPKEKLHQAMVQSWCVVSAYKGEQLVGTGRIVSDGIINGYLCGVIVHPDFRSQGIGKEIIRRLVEKGNEANLHIQMFSEDKNILYYKKLGFEVFATGFKAKR